MALGPLAAACGGDDGGALDGGAADARLVDGAPPDDGPVLRDGGEPDGVIVEPVRSGCILPLGGSITQGDEGHLSYRFPLWQQLRAAGYTTFGFVGSETTREGGSSSYPDDAFDPDHEGHWGWRADELADELAGWAGAYRADIALLHAGSNDLFHEESIDSVQDDLRDLVETLRDDNPEVVVLLAKLFPAVNPPVDGSDRRLQRHRRRVRRRAHDRGIAGDRRRPSHRLHRRRRHPRRVHPKRRR